MEQRLKPVESYNLSKGLNTYAAPSVIGENELSTSENIRHKGPGRITRRNGMEKFHATGITPVLGSNYPSALADQTGIGRIVIPYIQRVNEQNKRSAVTAIACVGNRVLWSRDGGTMVDVLGIDGSSRLHMAWRPRYASGLYYEDFHDIGAGFLDGKIYLGTSLSYGSVEMRQFSTYGFPYGCYIKVSDSSGFVIGNTVTGEDTGASGKIGYIDSADDRLFLYNWNGINFDAGESGEEIATGITVVDETDELPKFSGLEYGLAGAILEYDTDANVWKYRKWGIDAPIAAITATEGVAGSIEAGTYNIKYTFIRYVGGTLSGTDNQKLAGGELISESAPSPVTSLTIADNKKISYDSFDVPADPQVTHIRVYRDEYQNGAYHHVCDIAIDESGSIVDNYAQTTLELEAVQPTTDGYTTFGEAGENSGFAVEIADRRVFVGGNKTYPQRVYFSALRSEHYHSEYFSSSIDLAESPGESITAIKWWAGRLFVFMERSVYEVDYTLTGDAQQVSKLTTKGVGCATRNGIIDIGSTLLVMTEDGLLEFNGNQFGSIPITQSVTDELGTDLLNAVITKSNDYIYIITSTLRAAGKMVTVKHSDGTWACGVDVVTASAVVPDCFSYVPPLKNFGNTVDDSDYIIGLFRHTPSSALKYYVAKYDLAGANYDLEMADASASTNVSITAKFSPREFDFGGMAEATIDRVIALITSCGDSDTTANAPTGEFTVRCYVGYSADGYARLYTEAKLTDNLPQNKTETLGSGPIQTRFTRPFSASYPHQTGGVMSDNSPAQGVPAYRKMVYEGKPKMVWGRVWKVLFEYSSINNFEFAGFAIKFTRKEEE